MIHRTTPATFAARAGRHGFSPTRRLRHLWYRTTACLGPLFAVAVTLSGLHAAQTAYPETRRVEQVDVYHGVEVRDPYRWMETLDAPELLAWMQAQDGVRARFFEGDPTAQAIEARLEGLRNFASRSAPIHRGERTFRFQRPAGARYGVIEVQTPDGSWRPLLDLADLNRDGRTGSIGSYSVDGRYLTYYTSEASSAWEEVHVLRVDDGAVMPETLTGFYSSGGSAGWTGDGEGFFYVRYPVPEDPQAPIGQAAIYHHRIGTDQSEDAMVYERPSEPALRYGLTISHDRRFLIISATETGSFTGMAPRLFYRDLSDEDGVVREPFADLEGDFAFEGNAGSRFWIRTTHGSGRARLVEVDITRPDPAHWRELISGEDGTMLSVAGVGERFVVLSVRDARTVAEVYDFEGRRQFELPVIAPSFWGPIWTDDWDHDVTYYGVSNLVSGSTLYSLDVTTGETGVYYQPERDLDPDDFVIEQVFYESHDGTTVPMFLVYERGLERDGTNPVFMYGYGFGGWSAFPWQGYMVPWMELGGIYAVPNIRGGGEYGDEWEEAGAGVNKWNSIADYLAAAEWLIEKGYTSPNLLVANGGSASGILPAVAINERPDLFGAAVINYPTLDQLRFTEFGRGRSWVEGFGDPADPDDFRVLLRYSPYHNVQRDRCYPPTWVQVGEKDDLTTPMHGYKYAAALQAAQGCDNPIVLKIAWGAGHNWGITPEQTRETQAEELAFLVKVLGLSTPTAWQPEAP